jgi:hypothetical protein
LTARVGPLMSRLFTVDAQGLGHPPGKTATEAGENSDMLRHKLRTPSLPPFPPRVCAHVIQTPTTPPSLPPSIRPSLVPHARRNTFIKCFFDFDLPSYLTLHFYKAIRLTADPGAAVTFRLDSLEVGGGGTGGAEVGGGGTGGAEGGGGVVVGVGIGVSGGGVGEAKKGGYSDSICPPSSPTTSKSTFPRLFIPTSNFKLVVHNNFSMVMKLAAQEI